MNLVQSETVRIAFILITFFHRRSSPSVFCMDRISGLLVRSNKRLPRRVIAQRNYVMYQ